MELRPITAVKTAEQAVELSLTQHKVSTRNDPSRVSSLRVSSFPFCATQWWLSLPSRLNGQREETFEDTFFMGIGTHVHNQVQTVLDASPFVIRDWKCAKCGYRHEYCLKPTRCAACGSTKAYFRGMENEVRISCIVGHIDDSFQLADGSIDLLDYKTTSDGKIKDPKALPNHENVYQIEAYAAIKIKQGYNVKTWTLGYLSRNSGKRRYEVARKFYGHTLAEEYPAILRRIKTYIRDFKDVSSVTTKEALPEILSRRRLTEDRHDPEGLCEHCAFRVICPNSKKVEKQAYRVFDLIEAKLPIRPLKSLTLAAQG
jgi:hypothetical protein